jgi:Flp pilus assembly protein TadG
MFALNQRARCARANGAVSGVKKAQAPAETDQPKRKRGFFSFVRNRRGVTAVEFALVGPPFLWLMMGLAENGLIFNMQSNLDFAMMETQREIRTGQVQLGGLTKAALKTRICQHMEQIGAPNCALNLYLDVRSFDTFQALDAPNLITNNNVDDGKTAFKPGNPGQVVLVRGLYTWKLLTPVISSPMANLGPNTRLLTSTALFMNEPYAQPAS